MRINNVKLYANHAVDSVGALARGQLTDSK